MSPLAELNGQIVIDGYLKPIDGHSERLKIEPWEEATFHNDYMGDHSENYVVIRDKNQSYLIKRVIPFSSFDILKFRD